MAEVKIKFSAETAEAQKQLEELNKTGERIKRRLAEGGTGNRREDLQTLKTAKEQLAAAEAEKKEIQEKIKAQAQAVRQAQEAVNATQEGTKEHKAATRELEKQRSIMTNLTTLGRTQGQAVDAARSNVGLARQVTRLTPQVNPAPAVSGFARIRAAASSTVARIKSGFASASAGIGKAFSGMKMMAGAALAYIGVNSCKQVIDELDNLSKHARSLDIDTASFQKLKYAADSNNVSFEQVESSIGKMKRSIGEAAQGSNEAKNKLAMLGLTVEQLQGKTTAQQFDMIAQAITSIQDPAKRTAAAMKWFEEGGAKMMDFLRNYKQQGDDLAARGGIIDDAQLKAAEEFNQSLTNISTTLKGLAFNSGFLTRMTELLKLVDFAAAGAGKIEEKKAATRNVYNRRSGSAFAVEKMIASGNYSPAEAKRLRSAAELYGEGKSPVRTFRGGVLYNYNSEYSRIDAELQARGMGVLARRQKKGWFGSSLSFGEDTTVTARQTEEERRAEALKVKAEKERRAKEAADKAEAARKAQAAAAAAAEAAKEKDRQDKINAEIKALEEKYRLQQMINQGKGREAAIEEALNRARKQAGGSLSPEQEARIRELTGASYDLSHPAAAAAAARPEAARKLGNLAVVTNSLTARGGWAGGAAMVDHDQYNRAIAQSGKQSADTLTRISNNLTKLTGG